MTGENGHQKLDATNGLGGLYGPGFKGFPSLPIVTPDPPPRTRSQAEKYGGLFYLGVGGLAILIAMVGWFSFRLWTLREVFMNIYVLNDRSQPENRRMDAAFALSRDPRTTTEQRKEVAFRKDLPELARYLCAEALGADIVSDNPRGYSTEVARSEGWPDWLRLLSTRPIALAAADGAAIPAEPLDELRKHPDPMIGLWAAFAEAVSAKPVEAAFAMIEEAAATPGPLQELAIILRDARSAPEEKQRALLSQATYWLRTHHPDAIRIWKGWEVRDGKLIHTESP